MKIIHTLRSTEDITYGLGRIYVQMFTRWTRCTGDVPAAAHKFRSYFNLINSHKYVNGIL